MTMNSRRTVSIALALLLSGIAVYGSFSIVEMAKLRRQQQGSIATGDTEGGDSSAEPPEMIFRERSGREFDLESLRGKVWVGCFFFTKCPGPCTSMNRAVAQLQCERTGDDVTFVSISCDPQTDTPGVLMDYASTFQPSGDNWLFLNGEMELVQWVGLHVLGVPVSHKTHSERVVLVGPDFAPVAAYLTSDPKQMALLHDKLDELLQHTPPEKD